MKKKVIDKNGRLFGVVSIIDLVIILVILILAVGVYVKFFVLDKTSVVTEQQTITYTLFAQNVREETMDCIQTGDILYHSDSGILLGTITNIQVKDAVATLQMLDGTNKEVPVEDRYDMYLTMETKCTKQDGRVFINKTYELSADYSTYVQTKYAKLKATITELG